MPLAVPGSDPIQRGWRDREIFRERSYTQAVGLEIDLPNELTWMRWIVHRHQVISNIGATTFIEVYNTPTNTPFTGRWKSYAHQHRDGR